MGWGGGDEEGGELHVHTSCRGWYHKGYHCEGIVHGAGGGGGGGGGGREGKRES